MLTPTEVKLNNQEAAASLLQQKKNNTSPTESPTCSSSKKKHDSKNIYVPDEKNNLNEARPLKYDAVETNI